MIEAIFIGLVSRLGVAQRFQRLAAWIAALVAAIALAAFCVALVVWLIHQHDEKVIERNQAAQREQDVKALDISSEERASDALKNVLTEKERENAINAAPTGGTVSDADLRLNCLRLRQIGRVPEPCRSLGGQ